MAKKTKKSNNQIIFILVGILAVFVIILMVGKSQGWIGKKPEIKVELAKVERKTIVEKVSASGMIQPVIEVKISPEVSGEIILLNIEEGDSVKNNDVLLKIRPDNFIASVERSEANLNQVKANFADANARLARAQATFTRSKLEYGRQQKLYTEKVISDADFELAEANFKIAQQDLESAKQSVEASGYIVRSSQATLNEAKENLRRTTILAPMSGIVSKLLVEKGETVLGTSQMQGTEMLRIADLSNMEVRVDVNENDIVRVSLGDTAMIDVDSYSYMDKVFRGVVTQIANSAKNKVSADAVTEFEVRIKILDESFDELVNTTGQAFPFRPGMTASVEIITETRDNILTVPLAAVTTRNKNEKSTEGGDSEEKDEKQSSSEVPVEEIVEVVFKVVDGKAVKSLVKTGISDFERIQILEGLSEEDQIISGPFLVVSKRLKDGELVTWEDKEKEEKTEKKEDTKEE